MADFVISCNRVWMLYCSFFWKIDGTLQKKAVISTETKIRWHSNKVSTVFEKVYLWARSLRVVGIGGH